MKDRLRIAVVIDEPAWHAAELRRALESLGAEVRLVRLQDCRLDLDGDGSGIVLPGFAGDLPDGVLVRDVPGGTLEQVVARLDLLHALRDAGVAVYNDARVIERTVDKGMTSLLLRRAGVATPPTCVTEAREQAAAFCRREHAEGHEVVIKPLFGSLGVGLRRLRDGDALPEAPAVNGVWYLQRYIETGLNGAGWNDWRLLVVGGAVVAAMIRHGSDWIASAARGARCEPVVAAADVSGLALVAAAAVGADHAGVDLVRDREGNFTVLEVNGIPGWRALQGVTPIDLADRIARDFLSRRLAGGRALVR